MESDEVVADATASATYFLTLLGKGVELAAAVGLTSQYIGVRQTLRATAAKAPTPGLLQ